MRDSKTYPLFDGVTISPIVSSTDATPIVMTVTSHGLATGDRVTITAHLVNTKANGSWFITKVSANTYSLDDSTATGGGAGIDTGAAAKAAPVVFAGDYRHAVIQFSGATSPDFILKTLGSDGKSFAAFDDAPEFAAPASPTNMYEGAEMKSLEAQTTTKAGNTGFEFTGTAGTHRYEINMNRAKWLGFIPFEGGTTSSGTLTAILTLSDNE